MDFDPELFSKKNSGSPIYDIKDRFIVPEIVIKNNFVYFVKGYSDKFIIREYRVYIENLGRGRVISHIKLSDGVLHPHYHNEHKTFCFGRHSYQYLFTPVGLETLECMLSVYNLDECYDYEDWFGQLQVESSMLSVELNTQDHSYRTLRGEK